MQLVIHKRILYSYLMSIVLFLNFSMVIVAGSEQASSQTLHAEQSVQELYKPVTEHDFKDLSHEELFALAEKYGVATDRFSDVEIKDIIINFIYSTEYQDAVRSLGDYSLEQLHILAERHGVLAEGLSKEQLQRAILRRIVSTVRPTPLIPGTDLSTQTTKTSTLLLAALMRRVALLVNENPQKNNAYFCTSLLTMPFRYWFPFLMTAESGEAKKLEEIISNFELSPASKKIVPLLLRLPGTFMGAGYDLDRFLLQEKCGYMLGCLAEVSLLKLLPALAYQKYQGYQHVPQVNAKGEIVKHPDYMYAEKMVGHAILESADIGFDVVRMQARRILYSLVGNNIIKMTQDATSDIVNFELMDIGLDVLRQKALQTDFGLKKDYLDKYLRNANHPTLAYYPYDNSEVQEKYKNSVIESLLIHAATGPITIMMQTKQGDILTKGIGRVGGLLGKFFVAIGLCKKTTLDSGISVTKALIQNFIAPLMISPSVIQEFHEMLQSGNFAGWQKNKGMTRSVARYIVKSLLKMALNYQAKPCTGWEKAGIAAKVSGLLTLWYLYHSEGALSLQGLMMGGSGEEMSEDQIRAYQAAIAAYQAEMAQGAAAA